MRHIQRLGRTCKNSSKQPSHRHKLLSVFVRREFEQSSTSAKTGYFRRSTLLISRQVTSVNTPRFCRPAELRDEGGRWKKGESHLKHQSYQDENHQAEHDVRVVLNEELLAKERVTLVSSSKCHVKPTALSPLYL